MLATQSGRVIDGPEWLHEIKYDGFRLLAQWDAGDVRLQSKSGADATSWFPEVAKSLATMPRGRGVTDGEVCVLDEFGRPDFDRLMRRARQRGHRPGSDTVVYCVFDVLAVEGRSTMALPLLERKQLLRELFESKPPFTLVVQDVDQGDWLFAQAEALGLEGVVSKRVSSLYVPGVRTLDWVKRKRPGATPAQRFARGPNKAL